MLSGCGQTDSAGDHAPRRCRPGRPPQRRTLCSVMYDVIVVGYGPTGMLTAIQLGRAGLRVAVLERYSTLYNLPRVGIVHDDVLRIFQEVGCINEIWPSTQFLPVFDLFRNGKVLLSSPVSSMATHGWPEYTSIYQPAFEKELDRVARLRRPSRSSRDTPSRPSPRIPRASRHPPSTRMAATAKSAAAI